MASDAMKRNLLYMLLALLPALSCQREYAIFDDLSITNHTLNIGRTPGQTHIMVYSTGSWTVALEKDVEWASLNRTAGEGLGDFVLSWSANYGVTRHVDVLVSRDQKTERIHVVQAGSITSPYITLERSKVVLPRQGTSFKLGMTTNLGLSLDEFKAKAVYFDGAARDTLEVGDAAAKAWVKACRIDENEVEFTVGANDGTQDRTATLMVYMTDSAGQQTWGEVSIVQTASDPVFELESGSGDYYANAESHLVPAKNNNIWSLPGVSVAASDSWIGDMVVQEDGLAFSTQENTTGAPRSATLTVSYTSPDGLGVSGSFVVNQSVGKFISFSELRTRVPGRLRGNEFLEGFIVSDPGSPNVCSSPQTGQYAFDRSENYRTAYLESTDGSLGVCIKFTDEEQNVIPRWSKVHLRLDGVTLVRESAPMRFTIQDVTSSMFTVLEGEGGKDAVPVRQLSISQLSDTDIYTYVSLQEVEILCKDGAFTNATEGYSMRDDLNPLGRDGDPRWDVAPLLCSDSSGDGIFMLTNAAAPWRRTGWDIAWNSCVPQGAGTLNGILVSDEVAPVRWGNLGKYQIRPMTLEEIDLNGPTFSNTICEWNWNSFEEKLTPDEGQGTFSKYDAATRFVQDYNNPYLPTEDSPNGNSTENLKGLVQGAAICLTQNWWDDVLGQGKFFDVSFSTVGISGTNLIFGIVWGHGLGSSSSIKAPSHWNVLYSTDGGTTFQSVPAAGSIKQRSIVWISDPSTSQDACPGYTEHLVKLPVSCFEKSKVTVRLQVADGVTDIAPSTSATTWKQALGLERGTLTSNDSGPVRIGTMTVRYN